MKYDLYHGFSPKIKHTLDGNHETRTNKNWPDQPHVTEIREYVGIGDIAKSEDSDGSTHGEEYNAQRQVTVAGAVASTKST